MTTTHRRAAALRRSGRRGAAGVTATVVALAAFVVAADLALVAARGSGPVRWLGGVRPVGPADAADAVASLPTAGLVAVAAGCAVVGLLLLGAALLPGGRRRRTLAPDGLDVPVVADRAVLTDALATAAAHAAGTPDGQVSVRLRRSADVTVAPFNGADVRVEGVRSAVEPLVGRWGLNRYQNRGRAGRPVPVRVVVAEHGTVAS